MFDYWKSLTNWKKTKLVVSLLFLTLIIIFSIQNWGVDEIKLVFFSIKIPLTLLIAISMFIGYTLAKVAAYKNSMEKENEIKNLKSRLKEFMTDKKDLL